MRLVNGQGPWFISEKEVIPITNHPAWLFVDHQIFKVEHINGNMVKPFRQRNLVRIPKDKVKTYFQKFIVKLASRLDIEAEGFDVVQYNTLQGCELELVPSLLGEDIVLQVSMQYPHSEFTWGDAKPLRTTLEFAAEEVRIIHVKRDPEREQNYIDALMDLGLENRQGGYFCLALSVGMPAFGSNRYICSLPP